MKFTCAHCHKDFSARHSNRKYCDRICMGDARRGKPRPGARAPIVKICPCGKPFTVGDSVNKPYHLKYHSHACAVRSQYHEGPLSNTLTVPQAAYLAGFVDGEGCIGLYSFSGSIGLRLSASNTVRAVLDWCVEMTKVGTVREINTDDRRKPGFIWICSSLPAESVLLQIKPYMIVKRPQVELALEFMSVRDDLVTARDRATQENYRVRMHTLNRRGPIEPVQHTLLESSVPYVVAPS